MHYLRRNSLWILASITLFLMTCGGKDATGPDQVSSATSQLCSNVLGAQAIYWDLSNGLIRTDLPGGVPPTVKNIGGNFFHPGYPPLSFIYPAGWAPETIAAPQTVGVNLIRQDGRAVWRWLGTAIAGVANARQVRDLEVNQFIQFLGLSGNVETVCFNESSSVPAPGIFLNTSTILVRVSGFTAVVGAQTTTIDGLPTTQVGVQLAVGPTNEYDQLIFDVFLAIGFQLLYGNNTIKDSDGDGVIDSLDNFPFDPTRS